MSLHGVEEPSIRSGLSEYSMLGLCITSFTNDDGTEIGAFVCGVRILKVFTLNYCSAPEGAGGRYISKNIAFSVCYYQ